MKMPDRCPACSHHLRITALACPDCGTRIEGSFQPCPVCSLEGDDRSLLELYLRVRGNAKEVERALGVSYPTVRARLDRLWSRLNREIPDLRAAEDSALEILTRLREGKLGAEQAASLLRSRGRPSAGSS